MISGYIDAFGAIIMVVAQLLSTDPQYNIDYTRINVKETFCLAQNIWFEARGESEKDWIMVGLTTMNRIKDTRYPDTICEVVWDEDQFSWTDDGRPDSIDLSTPQNKRKWLEIIKTSILIVTNNVEDISEGATHYHAHYVRPRWARSMIHLAHTDGHKFYKTRDAEYHLVNEYDIHINYWSEYLLQFLSSLIPLEYESNPG